jgi:hypothetical protein
VGGHLHDRHDLEHLFTAAMICVVEISLIINVTVILVHLALAVVVFGRDAAGTLLAHKH